MSSSIYFEMPDACLWGAGVRLVMNGSDDTRGEWIKSIFIDILQHFLEYLSPYALNFMFMRPCILVHSDQINTNEMQLFMLFI